MSGALLEHLKQLAEQGKGLPSSLIEVSSASPWGEHKLTVQVRRQGDWRCQEDRGLFSAGQVQQARRLCRGEYRQLVVESGQADVQGQRQAGRRRDLQLCHGRQGGSKVSVDTCELS